MLSKLALAVAALSLIMPNILAAPAPDVASFQSIEASDAEIEVRAAGGNTWHVSNLLAGCGHKTNGQEFCSYQFHVRGYDTKKLPYFEADCSAETIYNDPKVTGCRLVGAGSQYGLDVNHVQASFRLRPLQTAPISKLSIELSFTNAKLVLSEVMWSRLC